jgi:hypothetical protein
MFDNSAQADPPGCIGVGQAVQCNRCVQFELSASGLDLQIRRPGQSRDTHPRPISAESIGGPLRRWSEVELVVPRIRSRTHKHLKTRMPPKFVGAFGCSRGRQAQVVAGDDIMKRQRSLLARDLRFDANSCGASRTSMWSQHLPHRRTIMSSLAALHPVAPFTKWLSIPDCLPARSEPKASKRSATRCFDIEGARWSGRI